MRHERTDRERLSDNAVLLYLYHEAQQAAGGEAAGDRLKLMKLAFLAAYPLYRDGVKALNLIFYRWKKGPMSNQVYDSWGSLEARGFLIQEEEFIVTEEGQRLAISFRDEVLSLAQNEPVLGCLRDVVQQYARLETPAILDRVYAMRVFSLDSPGKARPVRSIREGTDLIGILEEDEAKGQLMVPPGWQITLDLAFNPDALRNLQRGIEDSHEDRVFGWEAVGTDV